MSVWHLFFAANVKSLKHAIRSEFIKIRNRSTLCIQLSKTSQTSTLDQWSFEKIKNDFRSREAICVCTHVHIILFSHQVVSNIFVSLWPVARQAPLSMGFLRQQYWSGLPFPSPGDLPDPGIKPESLALPMDSLPLNHQGSLHMYTHTHTHTHTHTLYMYIYNVFVYVFHTVD